MFAGLTGLAGTFLVALDVKGNDGPEQANHKLQVDFGLCAVTAGSALVAGMMFIVENAKHVQHVQQRPKMKLRKG